MTKLELKELVSECIKESYQQDIINMFEGQKLIKVELTQGNKYLDLTFENNKTLHITGFDDELDIEIS
jgi:hypothetical protein